jgi:hypothetical protein
MPESSMIKHVLAELAAEGWQAPPLLAKITAAGAAAADPIPARNATLAKLTEAINVGDAEAAALAAAAYDVITPQPYYSNAGPLLESLTSAAIMGAIDTDECFRFLSSRFTATGSALADALAKVDADLPAETAAGLADAGQREAWAAVPGLVGTLDRLTERMVSTARYLSGVRFRTTPQDRPDDLLPLCVRYDEETAVAIMGVWIRQDVPTVMGRPYIPAHPGRAGLWGDLVAAGAVIEAPVTPGDFQRWPDPDAKKPEPQVRYTPISTPVGREAAFYAARAAKQEAAAVAAADAASTGMEDTSDTPAPAPAPGRTAALRRAAGLSNR